MGSLPFAPKMENGAKGRLPIAPYLFLDEAFVLDERVAVGGCGRERVASFVLGVSRVPAHPVVGDLVRLDGGDQTLP